MAKLASDYRKPNGQFVIPPGTGEAFVAPLPVATFHGIGPATSARMNALGIYTGADLKAQSLPFLKQHFGKAATFYYGIARGEDNRLVEVDRPRKSLGKETTFGQDIHTAEALQNTLVILAQSVWQACTKRQISGRTVTLKLRYTDFTQLTRSISLQTLVQSEAHLAETGRFLLASLLPLPRAVRLLGLTVSTLESTENPAQETQLSLLAIF